MNAYPSAPGQWFGRLADKAGSEWRWWAVVDDMELGEGQPAWAWPADRRGVIGYRLGFIEWDTSVSPIPFAPRPPLGKVP